MSKTDTLVIRITGDSGDGVQLVGERLTVTAAQSGRDVRTLPDFPAEIRAPAGTVGGVSGFQLAISEHTIFTAGETLDVLVALNPAALKNALPFLREGGLLLINEDSFTDKDWQKAGMSPDFLSNVAELYQVLRVPLVTNTLRAVEGLDVSRVQAKKSKNFYVLGMVLWLFDLTTDHSLNFVASRFRKHPVIADANREALMAGFNYCLTLELSRRHFVLGQLCRDEGEYRQITGVEAVALAAATVSVGTRQPLLVAGYPITPSSAILHECAKLADFGIQLFQAEDEIAAFCACAGAAFGGRLAMTCTSGPGLDLKSEALGLAVMTELPVVLVDMQRAGASTGLPTKTGQSDLQQALYGRHGEAPLPVIAASTPADCFTTIIEAFRIAARYMTPVIVLLDAFLANAAEPWKIPDPQTLVLPELAFNRFPKPYQRDAELCRSWNVPGTPGLIHQVGGLEKQGDEGRVSYDAENHQHMVKVRAQKIAGITREYAPLIIEGDVEAPTLIIGWGSTWGAIKASVAALAGQGIPMAMLHLRHLSPLPHGLGDILRKYPNVLVAELNTGHLCRELRAQYLVDARSIAQCNGLPFTVTRLVDAIKREICHEQALV